MSGRQPAPDGDDAKIRQINEWLNKAANLYSRQEGQKGKYDGGRFGVRLALQAALELLGSCGATSSQLKPLNRLKAALDDLDHGQVSDVLKPVKRAHRPRVAYEHELFKAHAVAALDLFMSGGMSEKEASERVARGLLKHGYAVGGRKGNPASVVRGWRKNIDLNRAKERRDNILRGLERIEGTEKAKAEKLLAQLPGIIPVNSQKRGDVS